MCVVCLLCVCSCVFGLTLVLTLHGSAWKGGRDEWGIFASGNSAIEADRSSFSSKRAGACSSLGRVSTYRISLRFQQSVLLIFQFQIHVLFWCWPYISKLSGRCISCHATNTPRLLPLQSQIETSFAALTAASAKAASSAPFAKAAASAVSPQHSFLLFLLNYQYFFSSSTV